MKRLRFAGKAVWLLAWLLTLWPLQALAGCRPARPNFQVSTTPPSAIVYINGQEVGRTPFATRLQPGTYFVEMALEGYETQARWVKIAAEAEMRHLSVEMPPRLPEKWELPDGCSSAWIAPNNVDVAVYCDPDGPHISASVAGGGLWLGKVRGKEWQLLVSPEDDPWGPTMAKWSPDGTMLAVHGGNGYIWLFRRGAWEKRKLLFIGRGVLRWSPDSRHIAVENLTRDIILGLLDIDGNLRVLLYPDDVHYPELKARFGVAWSPDGDRLVYIDPIDQRFTRRRLWTIDIATGERQQLLETTEPLVFPAWSPDGAYIAFPARQEIVLFNVQERTLTKIPLQTESFALTEVIWSPDGRKLAVEAGDILWVVSVDSGEVKRVGKIRGVLLKRWLGDGKALLVEVWEWWDQNRVFIEVVPTE